MKVRDQQDEEMRERERMNEIHQIKKDFEQVRKMDQEGLGIKAPMQQKQVETRMPQRNGKARKQEKPSEALDRTGASVGVHTVMTDPRDRPPPDPRPASQTHEGPAHHPQSLAGR